MMIGRCDMQHYERVYCIEYTPRDRSHGQVGSQCCVHATVYSVQIFPPPAPFQQKTKYKIQKTQSFLFRDDSSTVNSSLIR